MFDGLQQLAAPFKEEILVAAGEFGEDLGAVILGSGALGDGADGRCKVEFSGLQGGFEESPQSVCGRRAIQLVVLYQVQGHIRIAPRSVVGFVRSCRAPTLTASLECVLMLDC